MVEENSAVSTEEWFCRAQGLVPRALEKAREVKNFPGRWNTISKKLEQVPARLSDLSSHPCFSKNALCKEQLQAVSTTLNEVVELAELCLEEKYEGKLRMQSYLDSVAGKIDLNLRDCGLLIKTGVLGEVSPVCSSATAMLADEQTGNLREMLARLQIGHLEAKHKALDCLVDFLKEDEGVILSVIARSNIVALVQLMIAGTPCIREKTVVVICALIESQNCENWLVSEGVLAPLIRLLESGSNVGKEKAAVALERLSLQPETARSIVGHGGVRPLVEVCQAGDNPDAQAAAAGALKNLSGVPEARGKLVEEGVVKVMIKIINSEVFMPKESAAECLQILTASNDDLRRSAVSEGAIPALLAYLDGPSPQESAVAAVRNLIGLVPVNDLILSLIVPRLVHVLKSGSLGARQAATSAICRICTCDEAKRVIGESECAPLLVEMLAVKAKAARELSAQALASLMSLPSNCRGLKKDEKFVPNLVALLDPSPHNTAKKYAVFCLTLISSSKRPKKLMVSYGAIGYLKKLTEMEIPGAKKLLERLEQGKFSSFFTRK